MQRFLYFLIFIIVFVLGLIFADHHAELVTINYYFGTISIPLSLLLSLILLVGVILGILASLNTVIKYKYENRKLRKSVKTIQRENADLRSFPIPIKYEK
ncbi:LapA family protein [Candidatus Nitrosacidococcus tergens]|uniref:Lipopolysaccharide assembly protein A domain-containing protein n=1 Tax=Candidatus Nitrosacidococcus tergens TaxID=553981 RepID=A0A7G1Q981_9GAMM|nr:LapA family protein [Candidatus Nitrosacidococcus tergens]CAB1275663.1 conserved protein of unknown function [Candidatus Nitrosacidococcus tergens]